MACSGTALLYFLPPTKQQDSAFVDINEITVRMETVRPYEMLVNA
jgi:hypothetical protein